MRRRTPLTVLVGLAAAIPFVGRAQEHGAPRLAPAFAFRTSVFFGGPGSGTVSISTRRGDISCTSDCIIGMGFEKTITLRATAKPGSLFAGWGGPVCSGTSPTCDVVTSQSAR